MKYQKETISSSIWLHQGYGRMSLSVLCACAFAFLATGVENACMSFVLPAAKCDLELTTYRTGFINMAFMCGGVASAFFWGIVADILGRKRVLIATLLLDAALTLLQSAVNEYRLLVVARAINGFLIGAPSMLVFTYLSDLVGIERRQKYLNITGFSFIAAWLILPGLAWLVIPFKLSDYTSTLLPIHSWRLYLALMSLPGFISGFWLFFLPESPRLLLNRGRSLDALKILANIYNYNSCKGQFWVKHLQPDDFQSFTTKEKGNKAKGMLLVVLYDLKTFLSKAYAMKSFLIMFVFFANMAAGFGLNLWIPELLVRLKSNQCANQTVTVLRNSTLALNPSGALRGAGANTDDYSPIYDRHRSSDLVELLIKNHTDSHGFDSSEEFLPPKDVCKDEIDSEIFLNSLAVGLVAVLGNIICIGIISRYGATGVRNAAVLSTVACAAACVCLALTACGSLLSTWSNGLGLTGAIFLTAASLNGNILLIRLLLHALPSRLSALGVCWGAWWGRSGGVAVNVAVGALLDVSCHVPFGVVAFILAVSTVAIFLIKLDFEQNKVGAGESFPQICRNHPKCEERFSPFEFDACSDTGGRPSGVVVVSTGREPEVAAGDVTSPALALCN
ncbi:Synaptic vesicle glycoprotein 2B [Eumeta japonica]|uniref:Synaptic vesicle glycoprotein 2B n=1 Tax=Eumeta variegata TaxID=151549 RepID=A0A4C1U687_EUMVA|nr:Synaptic vesicle glycoprotein 2B [Eumeta japonica]